MPVKLEPPAKIITPYGGQLLWVLQSDVLLYVHLKDKNKIRHKKRWSQASLFENNVQKKRFIKENHFFFYL